MADLSAAQLKLAASATVAFREGDYERAAATFEQCLRGHQQVVELNGDHAGRLDVLYGYADALAASGRLHASLEVFAHISRRLAGYAVPLDKLRCISAALIGSVLAAASAQRRNRRSPARSPEPPPAADPLCCALCRGVLRSPMTALCGHTFCGQCLHAPAGDATDIGGCPVCGEPMKLCKPDVLVQRLVEKWWSPEQNDRAAVHLRLGRWDEALRACNDSLDKCPNNVQGLLLRSEVLFGLNDFQSSLADADNALKCHPTSYKAHERRAQALAALGFAEEALIAHCISAAYNRDEPALISADSTSEFLQNVAKLIQRLIVPRSRNSSARAHTVSPDAQCPAAPYTIRTADQRRRMRHLRSCVLPSPIAEPHSAVHPVDGEHPEPAHQHQQRSPPDDALHWLLAKPTDQPPNVQSSHQYLPPRRKSDRVCGQHPHRRHRRRRRRASADDGSPVAAASADDCRPSIQLLAAGDRHPFGCIAGIQPSQSRFGTLLERIRAESCAGPGAESPPLSVAAGLVDASDFDCVLCYRTLWQPVVTPCGHTYCLVCLDRCLDYSTHCPLCKFSFAADDGHSMQCVRNTLARQFVTRFIECAMQRFVPDAYRKRRRQEIEREPFVPMFVCTTAFPYVSCPLYVYEARYRLMIRRAVEAGDRQFGIVQTLGDEQPKAYSDYGTMLSIRDCVLFANGRSLLSTVGGRRFRVIERGERDGYTTAKVQYIYDEPVRKGRLPAVGDLHANVFVKAVIWYNGLPERTKDEIVKSFGGMPMLEPNWEAVPDGPAWAWYIIALLPLGQPLKVEILASTSLEKRLLAINKTLDYVAAQKRRSVCVQSCEGLQPCQAIDCCQQQQQMLQLHQPALQQHDLLLHRTDAPGAIDGAAMVAAGGRNGRALGGRGDGPVRTTDIIIVDDDDDIAMSTRLA